MEIGWFRTAESGPIGVVRAPLAGTKSLLDLLLGPSIFSIRALFLTTLLGFILASAALAATGAMMGVPFAGATPWKLYDENMNFARTGLSHLTGQNAVEDNQIAVSRAFVQHDGLLLKCAYMFVVVAGSTLVNGLLDFVCLALLRQLVREMVDARGYLTLLAALLFNCFLIFGAILVSITFIVLLAVPVMLPIFIVVFSMAKLSLVAAAIFLTAFGMFVWLFGNAALRVIAIVAVMPTVFVVAALLWAVISFPFKSTLHKFVSALLLRAAESGAAALGTIAVALSSIAVLIGLLAKLIYGKSKGTAKPKGRGVNPGFPSFRFVTVKALRNKTTDRPVLDFSPVDGLK